MELANRNHPAAAVDPLPEKVVARIPLPPGTEPRSVDVNQDAVWLSVGTPGYDG